MRPERPPQRARRRSRAHPGAVLAIAAATIAAALSVPAQVQAIEAPATSAHHDTTSTLIDADLEAIELTEPVMGNLPLITRGTEHGSTITWTSSDPDVVTPTDQDYQAPEAGAADPYAGGGIVTRPAYGAGDVQVTVTARATLNGASDTREFTLTIAEQGRSAPDAGYAAAYFKSDSDERIYQAATTGNDFFSFTPVNGGQPTVVSTADTTGLRDPYIIRSHDGDKYYMLATDLCIGCGTGWGEAQSQGSLKIEVWESTDLVHWNRTNEENTGIVVNQPEAGMTWAPEAYWDEDLQSYVVFFSSRLYEDADHTNSDNLHTRVFYVLTRDFRSFTYPPQVWQDTGYSRIDSTVAKIDDYYYRFTKNEEGGPADGLEAGKDIFLERSAALTAPTTSSDWDADPHSTWQLLDTNMTTPSTGQAGEGPEVIELNPGDPNNTAAGDGYVFLVDNYGAGGYRAFVTSAQEISSSRQDDRLSQRESWRLHPRGGLPESPRHGAFVSVPQTVLTALHDWDEVEAVDSTTTLTAQGRRVTAEVVADDDGQVAGTVTFSAEQWSRTVPLESGAASVTVPSDVSVLTAHYDGYQDGLVAPSDSEPLRVGPAIDVAAQARCVAGEVQEVVTVTNRHEDAAAFTIATGYGSASQELEGGEAASRAFATRSEAISGESVHVTAQLAGAPALTLVEEVPALSCG